MFLNSKSTADLSAVHERVCVSHTDSFGSARCFTMSWTTLHERTDRRSLLEYVSRLSLLPVVRRTTSNAVTYDLPTRGLKCDGSVEAVLKCEGGCS